MAVIPHSRFERFFREVESLDVDKQDAKRYEDFVRGKLADLLVMAEATASANDRDIIEPDDLPITKGLQERIHEFRRLDAEYDFQLELDIVAVRPQLDLEVSDATDARLPDLAGGVSVALAHAFRIIDPESRNPQTVHWERAFAVFDLLL
jgi:hypothetical protein